MLHGFRKAATLHQAIASSRTLRNAVRFSRMMPISRRYVGALEHTAGAARGPSRSFSRQSETTARSAGLVASAVLNQTPGKTLADSDPRAPQSKRTAGLNPWLLQKFAGLLRSLRRAARNIERISLEHNRHGLPRVLAVRPSHAQRLPVDIPPDTAATASSLPSFATRYGRGTDEIFRASAAAPRTPSAAALESAPRIASARVALNQWQGPTGATERLASSAAQARHNGARRVDASGAAITHFIARMADVLRGLETILRTAPLFFPVRAARAAVPAANVSAAARKSLDALRRTAAAAAMAGPLILAGGAAGALAVPVVFSTQPGRIAGANSSRAAAHPPIVINYSPNLTIQAQGGENDQAMARRVMEILERHGRELHQLLARELIRRQRTEFDG